MAINVKGRTVGCSYYDGYLLKLYIMQDMVECDVVNMIEIGEHNERYHYPQSRWAHEETNHISFLQLVKTQVRPTLVLTSARLDESVMSVLKFDGMLKSLRSPELPYNFSTS
jgi:hypothetical protein